MLNGYLNNISENIKLDQANLEQIAVYRDSSIIGSNYFMKMIEEEITFNDKYSFYFSEYFKYNPWLEKSFQSNDSGFEALKNSGFLSKIQRTTLETELYKYYNLVEQIMIEEKNLNNFMEEMKYDMYKNNIIQTIKPIVNKVISNTETKEETYKLLEALNYPSLVGSHSRNAGTSYLNKLYNDLLICLVNTQKEIKKITMAM